MEMQRHQRVRKTFIERMERVRGRVGRNISRRTCQRLHKTSSIIFLEWAQRGVVRASSGQDALFNLGIRIMLSWTRAVSMTAEAVLEIRSGKRSSVE